MKPLYSDGENTMTLDGVDYKAVELEHPRPFFPCSGCAFNECDDCADFWCEPEEREDGREVIWILP